MLSKTNGSQIIFNGININAIDTLSGVFVGSNCQWNWKSNSKTNSGFGIIIGRGNLVQCSFNVVIDPDFMDSPIIKIERK